MALNGQHYLSERCASSQSSLNFAMGPDPRKGGHYISASQTYLD